MIDISVSNLVKAYNVNQNVLDGLSFEINEGERVGLLGKNGVGKTTLFKILSDEISSDEGDVMIAPGKKIGVISQIPVFPKGFTGQQVLQTAFSGLKALKERMEVLEERMRTDQTKEILRLYDQLTLEYSSGGGYDTETELLKVCNGLNIPPHMRAQEFDSMSGGERTRLNLARLILEKTDILLLDEPTNHLDLNATEWLEEYLLKFKGTVLAISHDRYFLDRIAQRIIELENGKAKFYGGSYSFYVAEKQARYEEQLKKYQSEQAKVQQLEEASARLKAWGTGNKRLMTKAFAIDKRIERTKSTDRPAKEKAMKARFSEKTFRGDEVMVIKDLSKGFNGRTLFNDVNLLVRGGERIALLGDNGMGKSTFLRLIMGEENTDSGGIRMGPSVKAAYLPQIIRFDHPERSLLDTMIYDVDCSHQTARNRLGAFKFQGEDVFKQVRLLSGGEKSRLRLCMLMNDDINFLIMDEPTNHLDIASREWIEQALDDYSESLLFVSHDRYFIAKFATRIWALKNGEVLDFHGGFEEYRVFAQRAEVREISPLKPKKKQNRDKGKDLLRIEREIEKLERREAELDALIEEASSDYIRLAELMEEKQGLEQSIDLLLEQWSEMEER